VTPLDNDRLRKLALAEADKAAGRCPTGGCSCPSCGATTLLLRGALIRRGVNHAETKRVVIEPSMCGDGSYPFLASVRVDGREVYRIERRPDEVFAPDVLDDIVRAIGRAA
jgi:hypothetical protein